MFHAWQQIISQSGNTIVDVAKIINPAALEYLSKYNKQETVTIATHTYTSCFALWSVLLQESMKQASDAKPATNMKIYQNMLQKLQIKILGKEIAAGAA